MNEQTTTQIPVRPCPPPKNPNVDTRTSEDLQTAFAIVGALVAGGLLHYDLDNRRWVDNFETALITIARALSENRG